MSLNDAIATAARLRNSLCAEVERARQERFLLRSLNAEGLFERAQKREVFNATAQFLQDQLVVKLTRVKETFQLAEVTFETLRAVDPVGGEELTGIFNEIRSLAAALKELDDLNILLAKRTLSIVKAYAAALNPRANTYNRKGRSTMLADSTSYSRRV